MSNQVPWNDKRRPHGWSGWACDPSQIQMGRDYSSTHKLDTNQVKIDFTTNSLSYCPGDVPGFHRENRYSALNFLNRDNELLTWEACNKNTRNETQNPNHYFGSNPCNELASRECTMNDYKNTTSPHYDQCNQWCTANPADCLIRQNQMCNIASNMNIPYCQDHIVGKDVIGTIDSEVTKYCGLNPTSLLCSCTQAAQPAFDPKDAIGQARSANPQCLNLTCISKGYKFAGQTTADKCNTTFQVCNNTMTVMDVADASKVGAMTQKCDQQSDKKTNTIPSEEPKKGMSWITIFLIIFCVLTGVGFIGFAMMYKNTSENTSENI